MEQLGQLSVARMVDLPFRLLRPQFLQLWLPTTALAVVAGAPFQLSAALGGINTSSDGLPTLATVVGFLVAFPIAGIAFTILTGTVFGAVLDLTEGRPVDFFRSLRSLDVSKLAVIGLLYIAMIVGAGCCVVPGLAIGTYLGLATPAAFVEGQKVGGAFQRSLDLVRGGEVGWWSDVTARSLAVVVVTFILQYALGGLATLPQTILSFKSAFESAASGIPAANAWAVLPWWLNVATAIASGGVFALVSLYDAAATILVYRYARERLEGTGLETAIQDAQKP